MILPCIHVRERLNGLFEITTIKNRCKRKHRVALKRCLGRCSCEIKTLIYLLTWWMTRPFTNMHQHYSQHK